MSQFDPSDWYWFVGGTGPHKENVGDPFSGDETQVYSSKIRAFVPISNDDYVAWKSRMALSTGSSDPTTRIDTMANLQTVLISAGVMQPPPTLSDLLTQKETAGIYFQPTGSTSPVLFPTDPGAQIRYTALWNAIHATPPLRSDGDPMLAADGTVVPMSNADATSLIEKALAYIQACVARYATLQPLVTSDPSTDITTGWPANT